MSSTMQSKLIASSNPNYLPKVPPQNILEVKISEYEFFRGCKHSLHSTS